MEGVFGTRAVLMIYDSGRFGGNQGQERLAKLEYCRLWRFTIQDPLRYTANFFFSLMSTVFTYDPASKGYFSSVEEELVDISIQARRRFHRSIKRNRRK